MGNIISEFSLAVNALRPSSVRAFASLSGTGAPAAISSRNVGTFGMVVRQWLTLVVANNYIKLHWIATREAEHICMTITNVYMRDLTL